jgi:Leucine-rich repeat (LRR) protein
MKALDWIANRDMLRLQLEPYNNNNNVDHDHYNTTATTTATATTTEQQQHIVQRYALAVLYFATTTMEQEGAVGGGWKRELKWLSPVHECEWYGEGGVRKCNHHKQVTDISLWNNLRGTIPIELGALSKLQILYLARNHLHGTIPTELGQLTDLTYLGLHFNQLTGTVPSTALGGLTNLRTLYLEKNDITGTIHRTDPLCQLKNDATLPPPSLPQLGHPPPSHNNNNNNNNNNNHRGGVLRQVTSDCRQLVKWKRPEVECECCTKCFAA